MWCQSEAGILESEIGTIETNYLGSLWSWSRDQDLSWRIIIWAWGSPAAKVSPWMEADCLCIPINVQDRETIRSNRERGASHYVGMWQILNVCGWKEHQDWDRLQAIGPTTRLKTSWQPPTSSVTISTMTGIVQLLNPSCARQGTVYCRHSITSTSVPDRRLKPWRASRTSYWCLHRSPTS